MEQVFDPNRSSSTGPSFPHAFSGNPGGIRTGPPIKTFGGDGLRGRISPPQPQFSKERTRDTKDSEVVIFEKFLNFVPFVVQCVYFSL